MITILRFPTVTLLSKPQFTEPEHLKVRWEGQAQDGERLVEYAGRLCYMSQTNPGKKTTQQYIDNILAMGHGSVLEHANYSFLVEGISRSCTHELVRHRAGFAYSQLSQRYVDESDVAFVMPPAVIGDLVAEMNWTKSVEDAHLAYKKQVDHLTDANAHIQDAIHRRKVVREASRSILPNATETKIVVTANARAWRHFVEMRGSIYAEAEIRRLTTEHIFPKLLEVAPCFFGDYTLYLAEDGKHALTNNNRKV